MAEAAEELSPHTVFHSTPTPPYLMLFFGNDASTAVKESLVPKKLYSGGAFHRCRILQFERNPDNSFPLITMGRGEYRDDIPKTDIKVDTDRRFSRKQVAFEAKVQGDRLHIYVMNKSPESTVFYLHSSGSQKQVVNERLEVINGDHLKFVNEENTCFDVEIDLSSNEWPPQYFRICLQEVTRDIRRPNIQLSTEESMNQ